MAKKNKDKNKNKVKPDFKVVLWEDVGYSVREIKTFEASRYVDEDKTPFIYNEELKFMELYPQDMKDNVVLDEKQIDKKIKETEKELEKIRSKDIQDYKEDEPNTKDLEHKLMTLNAKKRALKFDSSASYVSFDSEGMVTFSFLRKGNRFYPFKWDTDTEYIHTAAEPVVKKAGILLRNKENKYMSKRLLETSVIILAIIFIIGCLANLFFAGWLWQKYDESDLAKTDRQSVEIQNRCSEIMINNMEKYNTLLEETEDYITQRPVNNIEGIKPE